MRWFMYRLPLAGVFEFGLNKDKSERRRQQRRPEASGTKGESERNDVECEASVPRCAV
jgi:hypothetical protein